MTLFDNISLLYNSPINRQRPTDRWHIYRFDASFDQNHLPNIDILVVVIVFSITNNTTSSSLSSDSGVKRFRMLRALPYSFTVCSSSADGLSCRLDFVIWNDFQTFWHSFNITSSCSDGITSLAWTMSAFGSVVCTCTYHFVCCKV